MTTQREDVADSGQSATATTGQILLTAHTELRRSFAGASPEIPRC
jgi:hypothetical protein